MNNILENFRRYLDTDESAVVDLSYSEMVRELNKKMPRAKLALTAGWYMAFDVPSGCIWDTSILTTKRLVAELKEDGWEVYE